MRIKNPLFFLNLHRVEGDDDENNLGGGGSGEGTGEGASEGSGEGAGSSGESGSGASGDGGAGESGSSGSGEGTAWPGDWRKMIAGDDEKVLAQLGRYASPTEVWNKAKALETRISSGELKAQDPFPAEGSDEQKAAWRAENGIPEKAEDYKINLPEGMVIGDADQPIVDSFLEFAHENNLSPEAVDLSVNWYFAAQEAQAAERQQLDQEIQQTNTDALRTELGENYRPVINSIKNMMASFPDGVGDAILDARLADGTPLGSDVGVIKALAQVAHELNPVTTLMGGGTSNMESINDEIAKLEGMMGNRNSEYYKGPNAEKMQARYRELVDAKATMEKRGQAA